MPILKPIYDSTNGMSDEINFLLSNVPIVGNIIKEDASSLGLPDDVIQEYFPSYSGGTYDWPTQHFGVDMLVWSETSSRGGYRRLSMLPKPL